jgi:hypothetical protein
MLSVNKLSVVAPFITVCHFHPRPIFADYTRSLPRNSSVAPYRTTFLLTPVNYGRKTFYSADLRKLLTALSKPNVLSYKILVTVVLAVIMQLEV